MPTTHVLYVHLAAAPEGGGNLPLRESGGSGGIRTHGRVAPSPVFKTGALNRSATLPCLHSVSGLHSPSTSHFVEIDACLDDAPLHVGSAATTWKHNGVSRRAEINHPLVAHRTRTITVPGIPRREHRDTRNAHFVAEFPDNGIEPTRTTIYHKQVLSVSCLVDQSSDFPVNCITVVVVAPACDHYT
jgi:hypothetical protein